MKKSRFTEEQVIYALRLAESGTVVARANDYDWQARREDEGAERRDWEA
ncbi:hypothetical protein [Luteibacter yeojuensis]